MPKMVLDNDTISNILKFRFMWIIKACFSFYHMHSRPSMVVWTNTQPKFIYIYIYHTFVKHQIPSIAHKRHVGCDDKFNYFWIWLDDHIRSISIYLSIYLLIMFADIVDHQWLFKATRNPSLDNNRRVCPYLYGSLLFPCIDILYISILLHKSETHSTWVPPRQLLTHSTSVLLSLQGSYCIF
jgi:hypothetical protein